ncbi:PREDICTED: uncharacterized protein LOC101309594 [Fragaria vesca subsp. vesca]|uniref:uncharacterized protein LOC101309594 n=1 Tax=Fragaria vesca subsp. vesca TaxID=101020 RepID=UPI0002C302B8|nr:PREDICTED: uncharacterized protein LOC101309594 [Fragaria vesca subsp. vesca]
MASLQIFKSTLSPSPVSQSCFTGKSRWVLSEIKFSGCYYMRRRRFRVCCKAQEADNKSNGEEPPESLFMKELRRRGMSPTSLLEEAERTEHGINDERGKEDRGFSSRNAVSTEVEKSLANQRERSMQLNSEGLEGLIPRGRLLLTLGGTFFLAFWPFIVISVALFAALYLYFGPTFIHDANNRLPISPPQYIDPYELLEDDRISQIAPRVK